MHKIDHTKNIIELKDISFSYGQGDVLSDINLEIHQGDYYGMVGPNGAGKTTLLKIILGLLKPTRGAVKLFDTYINDFKDWWKIGYVPQKASNFDANFPATVYEVVLMGRYARRGLFHRTTKEDHEIAEESLKQVDMLDFKDRLIGDLSGGQQQRVFIARALAGRPEVIFLDEPTASIDRHIQTEFYALLKKLNQELGLTLVLITHDIEMISNEAMHIACVDRTLTCHSTPEDFLKESKTTISHHHHKCC